MTKSLIFSSFLALSSILLESATAELHYAVYFEPSNGLPNPFGSDYYPQDPRNWDKVTTWPIFLDWAKYLEDTSDWDKGNQCEDHSGDSYDRYHEQSPIELQSDDECEDRHKMVVIEKGQCTEEQAKFYTTPYGLGVDLTGCSVPSKLDYSHNEDPWTLQEIVIKTPAEHSIKGDDRSKLVGEIQMSYKGSNDGYDQDTSHKKYIATVGVLLELGTEWDYEVEKLLQGWEKSQTERYFQCGVTYNHATCQLIPKSRLLRKLTQDEVDPSSTLISEETRKLYSSAWDRSCINSYYCFVNLYMHTETDYYYSYNGGLTYPPCSEMVDWRIMQNTLKISPGQLQRIERLIYMHLDNNCQPSTVGINRGDTNCPCCVNTNRPTQALSKGHDLQKCDQWVANSVVADDGKENNSKTIIMGTAAFDNSSTAMPPYSSNVMEGRASTGIKPSPVVSQSGTFEIKEGLYVAPGTLVDNGLAMNVNMANQYPTANPSSVGQGGAV